METRGFGKQNPKQKPRKMRKNELRIEKNLLEIARMAKEYKRMVRK